jgi:hypothetical protein
MKRKNIILITVLILSGLFAMQSCKKAAPIEPTQFVAAMPATPVPSADAIIPFTGSGQVINLAWEGAATNAPKWNVYFGKTSAPHLVASAVSANTYNTTITKGGLYYWQVSTTDVNNETTVSPVWSFDVNSNPAAPSGPIPANNAVGISRTARINWIATDPEGDALTYDVFLGKTAIPATIVATGVSDTTYGVIKPLSAATDYYWKVVATDPYGGTSVSPVWKFTTTPDIITAFTGDYNADEPAEDYSYGVTFTETTVASISTDNYWNSGWAATFAIDLTKRTYSMPLTVWGTYSGVESGIINLTTGQMTGTYTIWHNTSIVEQGVHTYTKI